ncbi:hypothetical protein DCAR_0728289 [Daucus carota subsp. sativus]|uniref:Uncharacterized protein n=1 Tax=Daucus carota subsp. sativus TaxID=79200 RepID=A0A164TGI8_DAUCS|nr:hypothetical protein DCAR_0728289 [Daucus carota subsp. sativus]
MRRKAWPFLWSPPQCMGMEAGRPVCMTDFSFFGIKVEFGTERRGCAGWLWSLGKRSTPVRRKETGRSGCYYIKGGDVLAETVSEPASCWCCVTVLTSPTVGDGRAQRRSGARHDGDQE